MGLIDEGERGRYYVTPQIMHVARAAQVASPLREIALAVLQRIGAQIDETVMLMQLFHSIVICVESVISSRSIRLVFEPGYTVALGTAGIRKIVAGHLWPNPINGRISANARPADPAFARALPGSSVNCRRTPSSVGRRVRARSNRVCGHVPRLIRNGPQPVATLSVAGPAFRISDQERDRIRDLLIAGAAEVSGRSAICVRAGICHIAD